MRVVGFTDVHAAAGGVGTVAVRLARIAGATVIGTAREVNHDYLRSIGATPVAYGEGLENLSSRSYRPRHVYFNDALSADGTALVSQTKGVLAGLTTRSGDVVEVGNEAGI